MPIAKRLGDHLLSVARKSDAGCRGTRCRDRSERDLTGFSHGASGIAWALLELSAATGDATLPRSCRARFRLRAAVVQQEHENWPDFRTIAASPDAGRRPDLHGGVVPWRARHRTVARARRVSFSAARSMRQEAEAAIRTTTRMLNHPGFGPQGDFTLVPWPRRQCRPADLRGRRVRRSGRTRDGAEAVGRAGHRDRSGATTFHGRAACRAAARRRT